MMPDLPSERVTPARPFSQTGLAFAGPLKIEDAKFQKKLYSSIRFSGNKGHSLGNGIKFEQARLHYGSETFCCSSRKTQENH